MPPMDSSAAPYFDGSWLMGTNCPDVFDVKSEAAAGFCSAPLLGGGGTSLPSSSGESCMSKVEQVFSQRGVTSFSSGPHLPAFDSGNPIVSDSLTQVRLDRLKPSECASSCVTSALRVDSCLDELASVFSTVTSAQRADSCLNELASGLPTGDVLSDPTFLQTSGCTTSTGGVIPATHADEMPGLIGVGGTAHPTSRHMAALNAALNTGLADISVSALRHSVMPDPSSSYPTLLFRAPFPAIDVAAAELSAELSPRKKRRNVKISKDPQSVAARHRRERISDRIRILQHLVPGGTKMDTASMLDEAIQYVKYLKAQVQTLETVTNAANAFDSRLNFGPSSLYRNGLSSLPYGTSMTELYT